MLVSISGALSDATNTNWYIKTIFGIGQVKFRGKKVRDFGFSSFRISSFGILSRRHKPQFLLLFEARFFSASFRALAQFRAKSKSLSEIIFGMATTAEDDDDDKMPCFE